MVDDLKIEDVSGIGSSTADRLRNNGIKNVKDLRISILKDKDRITNLDGVGEKNTKQWVRDLRDVDVSPDDVGVDEDWEVHALEFEHLFGEGKWYDGYALNITRHAMIAKSDDVISKNLEVALNNYEKAKGWAFISDSVIFYISEDQYTLIDVKFLRSSREFYGLEMEDLEVLISTEERVKPVVVRNDIDVALVFAPIRGESEELVKKKIKNSENRFQKDLTDML